MRKKQKDWAKDMAYQRIIRLFELARTEFKKHPGHSNRYVQLARKIGMRYRVRMPARVQEADMQALSCIFGPGRNSAHKAPGHPYSHNMFNMWKTNEIALLKIRTEKYGKYL